MKSKKAPKKAKGSKGSKASEKSKASERSTASDESTASAVPEPVPAVPLDDDEMRLWQSWKVATERVGGVVQEDIRAETGLSDPDVAVLTSVAETGVGSMRQSELVAVLDWHRSRLSHQLTRMEGRGLVTRTPAGDGVAVGLTPAGAAAASSARPVHDRAVRAHLIARLSPRDRRRLLAILDALGGPGTHPTAA